MGQDRGGDEQWRRLWARRRRNVGRLLHNFHTQPSFAIRGLVLACMANHIQPENAKKLLAFRRRTALARRGRASAARSEPPEGEDPEQAAGRRQTRDKMTILISSPVRRRLRVAAAVQDRDISQVIEIAVQLSLDTWERERAARGLPPLTVE